MNPRVVQLVDPHGRPFSYKRFAVRLPEFLKQYPPSDYRLDTQTTDLLSLQTGRLSLLKEAIAAGKKPADVGLPGIEDDIRTLVCTAVLYDRQNQVIRKASASAQIMEHKDFEALETAAQQRLLASLGFGGEVFDDDEDRDMDRQGLTRAAAEPAQSSPRASPAPTVSPPEAGVEGDSQSGEGTQTEKRVPVALKRQVENLAARLGEKAPTMETEAQAREALQSLGLKQKARRSG